MADSAGDAADAARVGADPLVGVACPLLVAVGSGAADPAEHADNRCAASDPPAPLSLIQQRLVCLEADHVDCPRYVRATGSGRGGPGRLGRQASARVSTVGVVAAAKPVRGRRGSTAARSGDVPPSSESTGVGMAGAGAVGAVAVASAVVGDPDSETSPAGKASSAGRSASSAAGSAGATGDRAGPLTPVVPVAPVVRSTRRSGARPARSRPGPIVVALGILAAALVIAFAFTSYRGGLTLPGASPDTGPAGPSSIPSEAVSPTPSPSPTTTPIPTPSPTPSPSTTAAPPGTPQPSVPPAFVGLKPCRDAPDCYLYRVRSGDSLSGIAQHFGVTKAAVRDLNPEITNPSLIHVGDMIRIPLPPPG